MLKWKYPWEKITLSIVSYLHFRMSEFYVLFWEISPGVERNNMGQLAVGKTTFPAPRL